MRKFAIVLQSLAWKHHIFTYLYIQGRTQDFRWRVDITQTFSNCPSHPPPLNKKRLQGFASAKNSGGGEPGRGGGIKSYILTQIKNLVLRKLKLIFKIRKSLKNYYYSHSICNFLFLPLLVFALVHINLKKIMITWISLV